MKKQASARDSAHESSLTPEQRYSLRLYEFEKYYLTIVLLSGAAVLTGIAVAILLDIFVGIACVLLAAVAYVYFVFDEARGKLGIRYRNTEGHIEITKLLCTYGDCLVLPPRFIYADVRVLDDGALCSKKNEGLRKLYLPASVERIGKNIFGDEPLPFTVCFEGTREEWEKIQKQTDFSQFELLFECEYPRAEKIIIGGECPPPDDRTEENI